MAAIVGPTAVGKSETAVQVAENLGAEIVSIDSMQIYVGLDAGTDKPSPPLRARVPHHLVDLVRPDHDLTVAEFQSMARAAIDTVGARGKLPLLVGGSGLYFRAVVDDLSFPPRTLEAREALESEAERVGAAGLHRRLVSLDPAAAERIEPANLRRTVRALEVIQATGRRFSENDAWDRYESVYQLAVAGLERARAELYERISARVDRMLDQGLVEEARELDLRGLGRTARQALGYRQVLEAPVGATTEDLRGAIVRATKRFARRQESWFKADSRITWFQASDPDVAARVTAYFQASLGLP